MKKNLYTCRLLENVTRHPLIRMPVFLIGILAAIQRLRQVEDRRKEGEEGGGVGEGDACGDGEGNASGGGTCGSGAWDGSKRIVDMAVVLLCAVVLCAAYANAKYDIRGLYLNYASQYVCVYIQVLAIQGLSYRGGSSYTAAVLRSRLATFAGNTVVVKLIPGL